jgi:hypothetical protein
MHISTSLVLGGNDNHQQAQMGYSAMHVFCLFGWLVGWLVGWLIGWMVGCLVVFLVFC